VSNIPERVQVRPRLEDNVEQLNRRCDMSQIKGLLWRIQRGKSFKESLKEREGSRECARAKSTEGSHGWIDEIMGPAIGWDDRRNRSVMNVVMVRIKRGRRIFGRSFF